MSDGSRTTEIIRELGMSLGQPMIAVVGCGGAGCSILNTIYWKCPGVHTIALNTDKEGLGKINAHVKVRIGSLEKGECCRGMPELAEQYAEESSSQLRKAIEGHDIVFIIAGLGGATGSGSAPVVSRIAREAGAIVFSVPILPFSIEAGRREIAMMALENLQAVSNFVVPLDNEKLIDKCGSLTLNHAFDIIQQSVVRIIEKLYEHSASYVSDLIDEVSSSFDMVEDIVHAEHEAIVEEMPATLHTYLEPNLEFPFDPTWNEMDFS